MPYEPRVASLESRAATDLSLSLALFFWLLTFFCADVGSSRRMAGLRCLLDDPGVLAHDSSICGALACAAALAVLGIASGLDGNVGDRRARDVGVAAGFFLFN